MAPARNAQPRCPVLNAFLPGGRTVAILLLFLQQVPGLDACNSGNSGKGQDDGRTFGGIVTTTIVCKQRSSKGEQDYNQPQSMLLHYLSLAQSVLSLSIEIRHRTCATAFIPAKINFTLKTTDVLTDYRDSGRCALLFRKLDE